MLKNLWFQLHWLLGITAGLVLALVGVTGALLSFEDDIVRLLNPGLVTLEPQVKGDVPAPLEAPDLLESIRAGHPERTISSLTLHADPTLAAEIAFALPPGPDGRPQRGRGERRYVDPASGALLGGEGEHPRGEAFLRETMRLHRWLVVGDLGDQAIGKQIVGASTLCLLILAASGLYLRWPRKAGDWRAWLLLDWRLKGRSFLWELHSVVGTWLLLPYLLMALTGLTWSYDWYRNGLYALAGVERPAFRGPPGAQPQPAVAQGQQGARQGGQQQGGQQESRQQGQRQAAESQQGGRQQRAGQGGEGPAELAAPFDLAPAWATFRREVPAWSRVSLRIPAQAGGHIDFRYLDPEPAHERANNELEVDTLSGKVLGHERYAEKTLPQQLIASIFPLHSGSYFGTAGLVVFLLASLLMPLFAITGWLLYLNRRGRKKAARAAAAGLLSSPEGAGTGGGEPILIGFASQTGTAERLAWQSAAMLQTAGIPVEVAPLAGLDAGRLAGVRRALFVASTFGEGEPPDGARAFLRKVMGPGKDLGEESLSGLSYGLLALGNRQYENFCGFGQELDSWLRRQGAAPLFDRVEADETDEGALRHWQRHLRLFGELGESPDWSPARLGRWRLTERFLLNPGSLGWPCYHLALEPLDPADLAWQAGDVAEIGPRHDPAAVVAFLAATGLDGHAPVAGLEGDKVPLAERLACSILPSPAEAAGRGPEALAALLKPLPQREYSIASLPGDGSLQLLVRQMRGSEGSGASLGLGSGWLTELAGLGGEVRLRVRSNPAFQPPEESRPLILIGNGTGIAGLRAHLKAREAAGARDNWLIFGERRRAEDFFYGEEIRAWETQGLLARLDLAFSRDQAEKVYVQDRLRAAGEVLRHWLDRGAAIYICGSLAGMAPAVEATLVELIGAEALETLAEEGRYRRDVY